MPCTDVRYLAGKGGVVVIKGGAGPITSSANGNQGQGKGGGGAGAASLNTTGQTGGAGTIGVWIVHEYG